jgi:hypothetical protein
MLGRARAVQSKQGPGLKQRGSDFDGSFGAIFQREMNIFSKDVWSLGLYLAQDWVK